MALPDDIQARLQSEGLVDGSTGWKLTAQRFTPEQDRAVAVVLVPGGSTDHMGPTDEVPFQIMTRAEKGAGNAALTKLESIFTSLHKFSGTLNGVEYGGIFTDSPPAWLMVDDKERDVYMANFRALRQGPR